VPFLQGKQAAPGVQNAWIVRYLELAYPLLLPESVWRSRLRLELHMRWPHCSTTVCPQWEQPPHPDGPQYAPSLNKPKIISNLKLILSTEDNSAQTTKIQRNLWRFDGKQSSTIHKLIDTSNTRFVQSSDILANSLDWIICWLSHSECHTRGEIVNKLVVFSYPSSSLTWWKVSACGKSKKMFARTQF